jgi:hypothetical protein
MQHGQEIDISITKPLFVISLHPPQHPPVLGALHVVQHLRRWEPAFHGALGDLDHARAFPRPWTRSSLAGCLLDQTRVPDPAGPSD